MRKNQIYIIVGNFVYLAAQWALSILVVRLSNEYYMAGVLGLAITITSIFYIISCYGLRSYQVSDIKKEYTDQCYVLSRVITITIAMLACVVYSAANGYDGSTILAISAYMVYKSFEAGSDVIYGIFQNNDRYDLLCISMCIKGIVSLIVFAVLLILGFSLTIAIIGMCAVALITFLFLDVRWAKRYADPLVLFDSASLKKTLQLLKKSFPMVILLIAQPLLMSIPRLYFEQHFSTEQLGIYSSLSSPTTVITTFVSCAMMPYVPLFAKYYFEENKKGLYRLTFGSQILALLFGVFACLTGGLIGEWALVLLYGPSISGHVGVFQLIILVSTFSSMSMCLNALFIAIRKLIPLSIVLLAGCVLCYFITPAIVSKYAMHGVTYALMIAQVFQIVIACILATGYIHRIGIKK